MTKRNEILGMLCCALGAAAFLIPTLADATGATGKALELSTAQPDASEASWSVLLQNKSVTPADSRFRVIGSELVQTIRDIKANNLTAANLRETMSSKNGDSGDVIAGIAIESSREVDKGNVVYDKTIDTREIISNDIYIIAGAVGSGKARIPTDRELVRLETVFGSNISGSAKTVKIDSSGLHGSIRVQDRTFEKKVSDNIQRRKMELQKQLSELGTR